MFKAGDKVQDNETGLIGVVARIKGASTGYPVVVDFDGTTGYRTYTTTGIYDTRESRRIDLISSGYVIVTITQTFIHIKDHETSILLPLASTSFKTKDDKIIAIHNDKEYTIYTSDTAYTISQILNPTKKETL